MRLVYLLAFFALFAWNAQAGVITSTYTWQDGNTVIISETTNANGVASSTVISTLADDATAATSTKSSTTTAKKTTTAAASTTSAASTTTKSSSATTSASIATTVLTASGVTVTIESGTTLDYAGFSSIVAPSLEAEYSATASSAGPRQLLPSFSVLFSISLAILGGALGGIGLLI